MLSSNESLSMSPDGRTLPVNTLFIADKPKPNCYDLLPLHPPVLAYEVRFEVVDDVLWRLEVIAERSVLLFCHYPTY